MDQIIRLCRDRARDFWDTASSLLFSLNGPQSIVLRLFGWPGHLQAEYAANEESSLHLGTRDFSCTIGFSPLMAGARSIGLEGSGHVASSESFSSGTVSHPPYDEIVEVM